MPKYPSYVRKPNPTDAPDPKAGKTRKFQHLSVGALAALSLGAAFAVPAMVRSDVTAPALSEKTARTTPAPETTSTPAAAPAPESPRERAEATPLSAGAPFTLKVVTDSADELVPHSVFGVFVMPGETIGISVSDGALGRSFTVAGASARATGETSWQVVAPSAPGVHPVRVSDAAGSRSILLNVFVKTPWERTRKDLNGYRIGSYPDETFRQTKEYRTPAGFVEVTAGNRNTKVSPNFTIGQFLCKQSGGYPKYVAVRERLVLKLEAVLGAVHEEGIAADTLHVMSGFRTPAYNAALGNVKFSQHQYGGAADIFIDRDRNGTMDDINRDGRVDRGDTERLVSIVERMQKNPKYAKFIGGVGRYGSTGSHGPFVHVDARGYNANWG